MAGEQSTEKPPLTLFLAGPSIPHVIYELHSVLFPEKRQHNAKNDKESQSHKSTI